MRQILLLLSVFMSVSCNSFTQFQYPEHGGEFRLTVVPTYTETPQSGEFMYENTVGLPATVLPDINALYQSIDELPLSILDRHIKTSPDGRSVSITKINRPYEDDDPEVPSGVWIIPDWRDVSIVRYYPNFSRVRFLNGQYVMLTQDRPGDINTTIVDTNQDPIGEETYYWRVRGMWRDSIYVGSNGYWCAINFEGTLHAGHLGSDTVKATGKTIPEFNNLSNSLITRDGHYVILETLDGKLLTVDSTTLNKVDSRIAAFTASGMKIFKKNTIGNASFTAWDRIIGKRVLLSIDTSGTMTDIPMLQSNADYAILYRSPTGAYAASRQHVMPPGALKWGNVRTSLADPNQDGIPPICGPRRETHQVGWLYWD